MLDYKPIARRWPMGGSICNTVSQKGWTLHLTTGMQEQIWLWLTALQPAAAWYLSIFLCTIFLCVARKNRAPLKLFAAVPRSARNSRKLKEQSTALPKARKRQ